MDEVRQNKKQRELQEKLDSVRSSLDFVTRNNADMEDRMMEMMGPNAEGSEFLMQREIYTKGQYTPTKYDYGGTKLSSEEIALVNTAALCQPKSAMHGLRCSGKAEDTENVTSSFVFMYQDAMLTEELRKSIGPYIKATYNTARELGHDAIIAYNAGDPKPMAKILGDSIRQSNIYAINVAKFSSKATALVKNAERMMQLLEQDPALMENSGLDEAEMKRYRAVQVNSKLYQESLQAREALLLDAMGQQKLAPEEKQQYLATEALFRVVDGERARKSSETQESSPKYQQLEQEVIRLSIQTGQLRTEIEIAEKDPQQEAPEGKKRELMELEKQLDQRHAQLSEVGEITEPTETLNRMAENYEGVRQELTEHLLRQPKIQTLPEDLLDALNVLDSSENFRSLKAPVAERLEVLDTQRIEEYRQVSQIIAGDKKLKDASMDVYHTLGNLLKEDRTYIRSSDGKEFHICGSNKNPEKGTMGMLDVFAGPDYLDQPFSEVSRNMPSHFKMYCLSRGMTEDELCSLRKEPGPELKEKLLGWKDDFMQMVIDKDTDAISDMYVGICNMVEEDGARFRNVTAMCNLNETDPALLIKYSGKQSVCLKSAYALVKFAAGNLFSGYFGGLVGTKGGKVYFGRPFTGRPTALKVWVKYSAGKINHVDGYPKGQSVSTNDYDRARIQFALGVWNPKIYGGDKNSPILVNTTDESTFVDFNNDAYTTAYGELILQSNSSNSHNTWKEYTIKLNYKDEKTMPTHIVISCASSMLGDYFTGCDSSKLWLDKMVLVYE